MYVSMYVNMYVCTETVKKNEINERFVVHKLQRHSIMLAANREECYTDWGVLLLNGGNIIALEFIVPVW